MSNFFRYAKLLDYLQQLTQMAPPGTIIGQIQATPSSGSIQQVQASPSQLQQQQSSQSITIPVNSQVPLPANVPHFKDDNQSDVSTVDSVTQNLNVTEDLKDNISESKRVFRWNF